MATTGTYTYDLTGADIITEALRKLGVLEEGGSATAAQITDALPAFQAMVKAMANYGIQLWTNDEVSITLVLDQITYTTELADYLAITDIVFRDSEGNDTKLIPLTREEYYELNLKTDSSSLPTQYYWERKKVQTPASGNVNTLYIWPTANSDIAGDTLKVRAQRQLQDVGDGTDHIDVPQEYLEAIEYQLAVRLAPSFGIPLNERLSLKTDAKEILDLALSFDMEQESIYIQPSTRQQ